MARDHGYPLVAAGPGPVIPEEVTPPSAGLLVLCVLGGSLVVGVASGLGLTSGVAALAAVALGLAVLDRPVLGGLALAILVPILPGLRRGLPIPGLRLSEALAVGIAVIVLARRRPEESPPWGVFDWLAVAYVGITAVFGAYDAVARGDRLSLDNVDLLLGPVQFLLMYRAVAVTVRRRRARLIALRGILLASIPVSILAILQGLDVGGVQDWLRSLTGTEVFGTYGYAVLKRATGPFPHWHLLGGYLTVVMLVGISLLLHHVGQEVLPRRVMGLVLGLAAAAIVLSVTFTAVFGVVAGGLLLAFATGYVGRLLVWLGCAALIANVLFGSVVSTRLSMQFPDTPGAASSNSFLPETIAYRLEVWHDQFLPSVSGRWMTGYGPGLPPKIEWRHTESLYLTLVLRGGLPLLGVYGAMMWALVEIARRRAANGPPELTAISRALVALVLVLIPMHAVFPYFTTGGLPHLLWALAGIVVGAETRSTHVEARRQGLAGTSHRTSR